jgi:A/G-specific adenine glycosylase
MSFSNSLIHWYLQNKRDLPWRITTDSYTIWLSEIILQQTRVAQGTPYFEAFISHFPTVFDLAKANEEQVLKLWQGLGYYSRARNLHATSKYVVDELNGVFPTSYNELIKLKGIGEYTAAAIASFSVNENVAVLDGNVYRVLARYFNVHNDISVSSTKKVFQELAKQVLPKKKAHIYNQAIMEFGALQCVPKSPNCSVCVLSDSCAALQNKTVTILPIKSKKTKVTSRYFNYLVFDDLNGNTAINQRVGKGIWQNLYEFPVLELDSITNEDKIISLISDKYSDITTITFLPTYDVIHKLSHQTLHIQFIKVRLSTKLDNFISMHDLKKLPFPIVIHNFIERYFS